MSLAKTDYHEDAVLNSARGVACAAWTPYIALFTTATDDSGGGTEVAGGGYARVAATFGAPTTSGVARQIANSVIVDFGTVGWAATVTHMAIYDAVAAGNMRYHGALTLPQIIAISNQVNFPIGTLIVQET